MGSAASTPNRDSSDNTSDNPWWQIENQILELNPNTNGMEEASSGDLNSSSSNRSESDQQHREPQANETEETPIRIENLESENSDGNGSRSETTTASSLIANSENCVENNCSSDSSADAQIEMSNSERGRLNERQQSLEEFKEELRIKREMRTNAIVELRNELSSLRQQLAHEKEINKQLIEERNKENLCEICGSIYKSLEQQNVCHDGGVVAAAAAAAAAVVPVVLERTVGDVYSNSSIESDAKASLATPNITLRAQLAEVQFALQNANAEILRISCELTATQQQAKSLKEVIKMSKEIIEIRETELSQLKSKLKDIENSLAERELHVMSENLRQEYDRQLVNIRNLRALYEERARVSAAEKENLNRQLDTSRAELNAAVEKNKNLEEHIESLNSDLKSTSIDLYATKEKLAYYQAESKNLHDEMTVVNQLFGQLLAGFNGNNSIDIDKLTAMLEENRDLLSDITSKEDCKEGAAQIPKLIFDLVSQANKTSDDLENENEASSSESSSAIVDESGDEATDNATGAANASKVTSAQEIIHNLPKVWRVLIELLNHQQLKPVPLKGANQELCYKSIQTDTGPQMVLSVSKTFIRLKDLIMEKKFLQKETKKLKNLNSHLESRLGEQEQRLSAVTIELNKTWNLVGRMQRQHRQLHTHEQVLRYQLQQKRRMLNELKEELEYCRRKWALAKEKNNESQSQWESLRHEFSQRKITDFNNSGESGYSDSPASEEDDDDDDDERSVDIVSTESARNSRMKKKLNIEKFLLVAPEPVDRKSIRIHSVSPVRTARVSLSRRNSDSQITTQFATEVFQVSADVVQPLVHVCSECGESCAKHSVHFTDSDGAVGRSAATEQAQVTEPIVCGTPKPKLTNAQKLVQAKASTSKTKMSCELRKTGAIAKTTKPTKTTPTKATAEESLEEMFFRLSGSSGVERTEDENDQNAVEVVSPQNAEEDERAARKLAQIERLEIQCKQLMAQVMRRSNQGDELNKRADTARNKFKLNCNLASEQKQNVNSNESAPAASIVDEPKPFTSGQQNALPNPQPPKTDEQCLTQTEQEYLARRDERLKRLEAESQAHLNRMKSMQMRAASVDTKMDSLRKRAGDAKVALANVEAKFNSIAANVRPTSASTEPNASNVSELSQTEQHREIERSKSPVHRAASVDSKLDAVHLESPTAASSLEATPSSSSSSSSKTEEQCLTVAEREYLARRDARLKRLEAESQAYMNLVKSTNRRAVDVDTKLEFLHGRYDGDSDAGAANETQTTISEQQQQQQPSSPSEVQTSNNHIDDEPTNQQGQNNHSSIETEPITDNHENEEDSPE